MRTYKEVTTEPKKILELESITCELCSDVNRSGNKDWSSSPTEEEFILILHRSGTINCDGSYGTTFSIDLCPRCFQEKLIPWVKVQGGNVREEEYGM